MSKYRKLPVEVDAVQFLGMDEYGKPRFNEPCPDWLDDASLTKSAAVGSVRIIGQQLSIATLEGYLRASERDYIIRGIKGEIYPCKPDIFAATYEAMEDL